MEGKILLVAINAKYIHSNLAVYCLKEYAGKYKDNIEIAEYTINQYTDFIFQDIYRKKPKYLLFSCYIWNIEYVRTLIKNLKKVLKDTEIWVGGPEVSYSGEEFLEKNIEVSGVMTGEGEIIFNNLCKVWLGDGEKGENIDKENVEKEDIAKLESINGIVYRTESGEIKINPHECIMDLSDVPFPYDDLKKFENKIIYYESSRGCPFSCSYCLSSIDKKLRFRDIELVKKELKIFIDAGIPQVKFVDRTFNCKKSHAMEIWKFIMENDNGITNFHFEVSADLIGDDELNLFKQMRPGLIQLEIGVQTTNPVTIKEIDRHMDLDSLRNTVNIINSFKNIHQHLDLIAGLPYEDYESFKKSFNDVYDMHPEQLQLGFLKVLNGAKMKRNSKEYCLVYTDEPPYEVLETKWISYDDILKLKGVENMVEIYYNSRQFTNTIECLESKYETPFMMFEELGNYYELHKLSEVKHNRIQRYDILSEFIKNKSLEYDIFRELLVLDIYLRENIKTRPGFAKAADKEELKPYYNKYRECGKNIHIEQFGIDIMEWINNRKIIRGKHIILFDYRERNPVNMWCKLEELLGNEE